METKICRRLRSSKVIKEVMKSKKIKKQVFLFKQKDGRPKKKTIKLLEKEKIRLLKKDYNKDIFC
jgi:hypothetical protein